MKKYLSVEGLRHYHNFVAKNLKKLSDEIDTRIQQKFEFILGANTSDGEVLDARRGEKTLGKKIDKIDARIDNEITRINSINEMANTLESANTEINTRIGGINDVLSGIQGEHDSVVEGLNSMFAHKHNDFLLHNDERGYYKLPKGLILQWGTEDIQINSGDEFVQTLRYPIKFSSTCFAVSVNLDSVDGGLENIDTKYNIHALRKDTVGAVIRCKNLTDEKVGTNAKFSWLAIGI